METLISTDHVMFLAQSPFLSSGRLCDQATYPHPATSDNRAAVESLLALCHLSGLLSRYGDTCRDNWYTELSPGEQQRLAWVRMLYHKPRLAVLDEATSGVSEDLETTMYTEALRLGITLVSVGHRASLRQYHDTVLAIREGGSWSLTSVEAYNSQRSLYPYSNSSSPTRQSLNA